MPTSTLPGPHVEVVIVDAGPTARLLPPVYVSWVMTVTTTALGCGKGLTAWCV